MMKIAFVTLVVTVLFPVRRACECGLESASDRLFHQAGVDPIRYPWLTHLRIYDSSDRLIGHCAGSLIDHSHILSAAHCFVVNTTIVDRKSVKVYLGVHSIHDRDLPPPRQISSIGIHRKYMKTGMADAGADIAILTLVESVKFTNKIFPICLPNSEYLPANKPLRVIGWGDNGPNGVRTSFVPKEIDVQPISNEECWTRKMYHFMVELQWSFMNMFGVPKILKSMICTLNEDGLSPCSGDSGGPLMYKNPKNGLWYLFGIVSYSWKDCGSDAPSVYTKVPSFGQLIKGLANDACVYDI